MRHPHVSLMSVMQDLKIKALESLALEFPGGLPEAS